jgi:hypothetical protein
MDNPDEVAQMAERTIPVRAPGRNRQRKPRLSFGFSLLVLLAGASAVTLQVFGGHPIWPPAKHSAEYRQANHLFLRFQDALAEERWADALALCSERVRAKASSWPSAEAFFHDTVPVELLIAQDFGYWTLRANQAASKGWTENAVFYGLLVPLTEPGAEPVVQWYWGISATNRTWVVDYPPVKLEEYVAQKKARIQERENQIRQIRESLEPVVKATKTRLAAVSEWFQIGSPMLFRLELLNDGDTSVHYVDSGVTCAALKLLDEKNQPVPAFEVPMQIMVRRGEASPGQSVVLSDKIDLNLHYAITNAGTYFVQFSGADLQIGIPVPQHEWGPFGEDEGESGQDFISATNRFPSNVIRIEVSGRDRR